MKIRMIWEKILTFFGLENHQYEGKSELTEIDDNKIISIYKRQGFRIMIHSPESFAEVQNIVDQVKSNKPIILNLEKMEREMARRIIDFISGAIYGLDGNVKKISDAIFIYTPKVYR